MWLKNDQGIEVLPPPMLAIQLWICRKFTTRASRLGVMPSACNGCSSSWHNDDALLESLTLPLAPRRVGIHAVQDCLFYSALHAAGEDL